MATRLKKTEYLFTYMIIISLACLLGGFFLGASYMKNKLAAEEAAALEAAQKQAEKEKLLREQKLYREQDFVSFYYSVYAPVRSFKEDHFRILAQQQDNPQQRMEDRLDELAEMAENRLGELEKGTVSASSPLLVQAKQRFADSLRAYLAGIEELRSAQNSNALLDGDLSALPQMQPFLSTWLQAQTDLFQAVATWESAYVTKRQLPNQTPAAVSLKDWNTFPFHYRSFLAADFMAKAKMFDDYDPLDMTARIDALLTSNQAAALGVKDISSAIKVLHVTDAVRDDDFSKLREKLYAGLKTPEMPIYLE